MDEMNLAAEGAVAAPILLHESAEDLIRCPFVKPLRDQLAYQFVFHLVQLGKLPGLEQARDHSEEQDTGEVIPCRTPLNFMPVPQQSLPLPLFRVSLALRLSCHMFLLFWLMAPSMVRGPAGRCKPFSDESESSCSESEIRHSESNERNLFRRADTSRYIFGDFPVAAGIRSSVRRSLPQKRESKISGTESSAVDMESSAENFESGAADSESDVRNLFHVTGNRFRFNSP
ncbi:hypothetical protein [Sinorhizobium meliloti]|uniref:hypothetical protein n=1 Tax=Rhizobium meliloti TaxID=382 RepID=UPI0013E384CD|nr:hypothetical protein [Sinorhizobium meliloti]